MQRHIRSDYRIDFPKLRAYRLLIQRMFIAVRPTITIYTTTTTSHCEPPYFKQNARQMNKLFMGHNVWYECMLNLFLLRQTLE